MRVAREGGTLDFQTAQLSFSLSWSHYVFLTGIKNVDKRRFYEIEATRQNWSLRELRRQYDTSLYERLALSRDKQGVLELATEGQVLTTPADMLKEPYSRSTFHNQIP